MKILLRKDYKPVSGDYILLLFADKSTALFDIEFTDIKAPNDAGGTQMISCGEYKGVKNVTISSARLDSNDSSVIRETRVVVKKTIDGLKNTASKRLVVLLGKAPVEIALAVQESVLLGMYSFDKYKMKKQKPNVSVLMQVNEVASVKKELNKAEKLFSWVNFARDILNEPANAIHPATLSALFMQKGKAAGMKMTLWNEARLKKESCGGVLGVGSGAGSRPCMVIGEYSPARAKKHVVLVGKGVTFDTGGYCLKPGSSQIGMKMDMGGAAMMFSAACAIAQAKLPIKITVITPLVENDISKTSFHTEDVLKMRNGMTVEVGNTDAEGRLILADALVLASEKKADYIIDAATLTGACLVGLGEDIAGMYSTDSILAGQILSAAEDAGEYMWELPLHMPYSKQLDSDIADTSNMGGKYGGSITAALFLKKFVKDDASWAHIDIAGPGIKTDEHEHLGKGAKGFGVKSIYGFAIALS